MQSIQNTFLVCDGVWKNGRSYNHTSRVVSCTASLGRTFTHQGSPQLCRELISQKERNTNLKFQPPSQTMSIIFSRLQQDHENLVDIIIKTVHLLHSLQHMLLLSVAGVHPIGARTRPMPNSVDSCNTVKLKCGRCSLKA